MKRIVFVLILFCVYIIGKNCEAKENVIVSSSLIEFAKQYPDSTRCIYVILEETPEIVDIASNSMEAFYFINKNKYKTIVISNDLEDLDGLWMVKHLKNKCKSNLCVTSKFNGKKMLSLAESNGFEFINKISFHIKN